MLNPDLAVGLMDSVPARRMSQTGLRVCRQDVIHITDVLLSEGVSEVIPAKHVRDSCFISERLICSFHYVTYRTRSSIVALWIILPNVALQHLRPAPSS